MSGLTYARVWLDHPKLGCGYRRLVLFNEGRKWVSLAEIPSATIVHLKRTEVRTLQAQVEPHPHWRKLRRQLKARLEMGKALGFLIPTAEHKELLRALKEATS